MPTVYSRIIEFEKTSKFRFNQRGKLNIGAAIKAEWKALDKDIALISEWSQEPEGTFHVPNYPYFFVPKIDELIVDYVRRVTTKKAKKITEKPPQPIKNQTSDHKKERKRTPIQKPHFSGKQFKKQ